MKEHACVTLNRQTPLSVEPPPRLDMPFSPPHVVEGRGVDPMHFVAEVLQSHNTTGRFAPTRRVIAPSRLKNRNQLDVLLFGRDFGIHKGLGVNGNHTAAVLQRAGVRAQDMLFAQDKLPGKLLETLKKTRPHAAVLMAFFLDAKTLVNVVEAFPRTRFYVKCHSNPQFLAAENNGWQRLLQIADLGVGLPNLSIGCASEDMMHTLLALGFRAALLPNVYDFAVAEHARGIGKLNGGAVHIGMFGALRPFKNAIGQTCALAVARRISTRPLVLHINGTRAEMGSANDLAQMREICRRAGLRLEVHGWLDHAEFITLAARMHVALQASFTETFNYVAADCVAAGTPVVGSPAIRFLPAAWKVNPDDTEAIAAAILDAPGWDVAVGQRALEDWNRWAIAKLLHELTPESISYGSRRKNRCQLSKKVRTPLPLKTRTKPPVKSARKISTGSSNQKISASAKSKLARVIAYSVRSDGSSLSDDSYHS